MRILFSNHNDKSIVLTPNAEKSRLLMDIAKTKAALEIAYAGFDNAIDPDLIDCYIYEVNSVLKRYKYLLGQIEKLNSIINEDSELCPEPPVCSLIS